MTKLAELQELYGLWKLQADLLTRTLEGMATLNAQTPDDEADETIRLAAEYEMVRIETNEKWREWVSKYGNRN